MNDFSMYKQAQYARNHCQCAECGDMVHVNAVDDDGKCPVCVEAQAQAQRDAMALETEAQADASVMAVNHAWSSMQAYDAMFTAMVDKIINSSNHEMLKRLDY